MELSRISIDILKSPASKVTTAKEAREIISLIEDEFMLHDLCLGLAAPQIGISKTVSIIRDREHDIAIDLINPRIISEEESFISHGEGCMSFPNRRFNTPRFKVVTVEHDRIWMPESIKSFGRYPVRPPQKTDEDLMYRSTSCFSCHQDESACGGMICVAVQHEVDHLSGIILPDRPGSVETPYTSEGIRVMQKVGRNDPCPCGSNKKFKKCCIDKY